jgi:hypothetical protein
MSRILSSVVSRITRLTSRSHQTPAGSRRLRPSLQLEALEDRLAPATIHTFAGGGSPDGGPATAASLSSPDGVAVDDAGNLFIADGFNNRVRKVTPDGLISTVAGNGSFGYSGDGGPATAARFAGPTGVQLFTAGPQSLAAGAGTLIGGADLTVLPGAEVTLLLSGPSQVQAGVPFSVMMTAYDAFGNQATGYLGTVTFAAADPAAVLPDDYTFTGDDAGSHTFNVTLNTPGPVLLSVTDTADGNLTASLPLTVV